MCQSITSSSAATITGSAACPIQNPIAETESAGVDVEVSVQGNGLNPEITFSSNPALPEEEILARLLFGGSITDLSATDAVQLGAALASLRGGGGGMDLSHPAQRLMREADFYVIQAQTADGRAATLRSI